MGITQKQRDDYRRQLLTENPKTDPYFVDILLDVYDKHPAFVESLTRSKKKKGKEPSTPPTSPVYTAKTISVLPEGEFKWPEQDGAAKFYEDRGDCDDEEVAFCSITPAGFEEEGA